MMASLPPKKALLLVALVAIVVRGVLFVSVQPWDPSYTTTFMRSDAGSYYKLASNIRLYGEYSLSDCPPYYPDSFNTPGHPFLMAGVFLVFGISPIPVLILQILLSVITCLLVCRTGLLLFDDGPAGRMAATVAGLIMAVEPVSALYTVVTVTETLFLFLFVAACHCLLRGVAGSRRQIAWIAAAGACFGLAMLTRPVVQFFIIVPVLAVAITSPGWRARLIRTGLLLAVMIMTASPWLIRNYQTFGAVGLSTVGQYNLLFGNAALMESKRTGKKYDDIIEEYRLTYTNGRGKGNIDFTTAAEAQKVGMRIIMGNPVEYAKMHIMGSAMLMFVPGSAVYADAFGWKREKIGVQSEVYGSGMAAGIQKVLAAKTTPEWIYMILFILFTLTLYAAAMAGGWYFLRRREKRLAGIILLAAVLYYPLVTGPLGDNARYRIPVMPAVALFAGAFVLKRRLSVSVRPTAG